MEDRELSTKRQRTDERSWTPRNDDRRADRNDQGWRDRNDRSGGSREGKRGRSAEGGGGRGGPHRPFKRPEANDRRSEERFSGRKGVCEFYMKNDHCGFGDSCRFLHPPREPGVRVKTYPPPGHTGQVCRHFQRAGWCKWGEACRHVHTRDPDAVDQVVEQHNRQDAGSSHAPPPPPRVEKSPSPQLPFPQHQQQQRAAAPRSPPDGRHVAAHATDHVYEPPSQSQRPPLPPHELQRRPPALPEPKSIPDEWSSILSSSQATGPAAAAPSYVGTSSTESNIYAAAASAPTAQGYASRGNGAGSAALASSSSAARQYALEVSPRSAVVDAPQRRSSSRPRENGYAFRQEQPPLPQQQQRQQQDYSYAPRSNGAVPLASSSSAARQYALEVPPRSAVGDPAPQRRSSSRPRENGYAFRQEQPPQQQQQQQQRQQQQEYSRVSERALPDSVFSRPAQPEWRPAPQRQPPQGLHEPWRSDLPPQYQQQLQQQQQQQRHAWEDDREQQQIGRGELQRPRSPDQDAHQLRQWPPVDQQRLYERSGQQQQQRQQQQWRDERVVPQRLTREEEEAQPRLQRRQYSEDNEERGREPLRTTHSYQHREQPPLEAYRDQWAQYNARQNMAEDYVRSKPSEVPPLPPPPQRQQQPRSYNEPLPMGQQDARSFDAAAAVPSSMSEHRQREALPPPPPQQQQQLQQQQQQRSYPNDPRVASMTTGGGGESRDEDRDSTHREEGRLAQVRASHILLKHTGSRRLASWRDPKGEQISKRSRAEAIETLQRLLPRVRESPRAFDDAAREYSDCDSAQNGGNLGFFPRGKMQRPFEDAAYALRVWEVSDVIDTNSGVHLIMRTA